MELQITSRAYGIHTVLFDEQDIELLSSHKWHIVKVRNKFYARTTVYKNGISGPQTALFMHRLIMNATNEMVDHIDGNRLNNTRKNLRIATVLQNNKNRSIGRNNSSGYKGVSYRKKDNTYEVQLKSNGIYIYGGRYADKISAARKYNKLAIQYHGEFAKVNII